MSEVKRYNVFDVPTHAGHSLVERVEKDGKWVLFEDYAALHLQVQTLISANEDLRLEWTGLANERDELRKRLYEQGKVLERLSAPLGFAECEALMGKPKTQRDSDRLEAGYPSGLYGAKQLMALCDDCDKTHEIVIVDRITPPNCAEGKEDDE